MEEAFSTNSKILETVDSSNGFVTRISNKPSRLTLPLTISSPDFTLRGKDSPVNADVSIEALPFVTIPSNGIF